MNYQNELNWSALTLPDHNDNDVRNIPSSLGFSMYFLFFPQSSSHLVESSSHT
jgi:hypothetical protein